MHDSPTPTIGNWHDIIQNEYWNNFQMTTLEVGSELSILSPPDRVVERQNKSRMKNSHVWKGFYFCLRFDQKCRMSEKVFRSCEHYKSSGSIIDSRNSHLSLYDFKMTTEELQKMICFIKEYVFTFIKNVIANSNKCVGFTWVSNIECKHRWQLQ